MHVPLTPKILSCSLTFPLTKLVSDLLISSSLSLNYTPTTTTCVCVPSFLQNTNTLSCGVYAFLGFCTFPSSFFTVFHLLEVWVIKGYCFSTDLSTILGVSQVSFFHLSCLCFLKMAYASLFVCILLFLTSVSCFFS